tara:strand:- start:31 stop:537 length:507 start_codon:yes stop_codon:yes gene_type:complete
MHLLIKPENILVTITNEGSSTITEFENLYREHSQPHEGDAGLDLFNPEDIIIGPNEKGVTVDLKIQCEAFVDSSKEKNCWYYLYPRSSISKTPLRLSNSTGIIDAGYRGTIMAKVDNVKDVEYTIKAGSRLFQIVPAIVTPDNMGITFEVVNSLSNTERGNRGFGSSG